MATVTITHPDTTGLIGGTKWNHPHTIVGGIFGVGMMAEVLMGKVWRIA